MDYQFIKVELSDGIAIVTIDRQEALNALNSEVLSSLHKVFYELAKESNLKAVILTGAGKSFVAGADIKEMTDYNPVQARAFSLRGQSIFNQIEDFPKPVIAAVNGFALGGGCELAMSCDFRIASDKAKLGQPEVNLGVTPGFGGTQRLARLVGRSIAKYLLFTGEIIKADRALQIGLVDEVIEAEKLMERCMEIAKIIAKKGSISVSYCKRAINKGIEIDLNTALGYEAELFAETFATFDQKEGMKAFAEKREAQFKGE
ncbi:MAG: enoyl-CoA hydratase/isomerase family protein [Candidatus Coatesbacteria bacterium]|nr:enoyl-CoA hydratase/isomerase family protein [Candidatus Coatesbacteria bacterium]